MDLVNAILNRIKGYSFADYFICMCDLDIFNILYDQDETIDSLARKINISGNLLIRVLRPLISLGLIVLDDNNNLSITKAGRMFSVSQEENVLPKIFFHKIEGMHLWHNFRSVLMVNEFDKDEIVERDKFIEYANDAEKAQLFTQMMNRVSLDVDITEALSEYVGLEKTFVDVGGGIGTLSFAILDKIPTLKGIIFDLEHLREESQEYIRKRGLSSRCTFQEGNFFDFVPAGDFFILSRVLHDWPDSKCTKILNNIRKQMSENSVLYIIEKMLPNKITKENFEDFMMDLNVFCMCGGQERTRDEFNQLLLKSHLAIENINEIRGNKKLRCLKVVPI